MCIEQLRLDISFLFSNNYCLILTMLTLKNDHNSHKNSNISNTPECHCGVNTMAVYPQLAYERA